MLFRRLRQHRQPWALALVLALLWLTGWGQAHRVLHLGSAVPALSSLSAAVGVQDGPAPLGGHEEGGTLCQLLDHLSQGAAPLAVVAALAAMPMPLVRPAWTPRWRPCLLYTSDAADE